MQLPLQLTIDYSRHISSTTCEQATRGHQVTTFTKQHLAIWKITALLDTVALSHKTWCFSTYHLTEKIIHYSKLSL